MREAGERRLGGHPPRQTHHVVHRLFLAAVGEESQAADRGPDAHAEVHGQPIDGETPDLTWHGTQLAAPDWGNPDARTLACTLGGLDGDPDLHVIANMYWAPLDFELPPLPGRLWARAIDTSLPAGADITDSGVEPAVDTATYSVAGRSVVVLVSRPTY